MYIMENHHLKYANDETYKGTIKAIHDNYELFKLNVPNFVDYSDIIDDAAVKKFIIKCMKILCIRI